VSDRLFSFPNPVNELAARTVAGLVLATTLLTIVLSTVVSWGFLWVTAGLAYGFLARVLTGPKLSLFGQLATRVIAVRLGPARLVAGPPKRFAQAVGAVFTVTATIFVGLGLHTAALVMLALVVVAATLESVFGYCVGCKLFAVGMRLGWVPEQTCAACADITSRINVELEPSGTLAR
jgi:hypothetical protein